MPKLEGEPVIRLHTLLWESDLEILRKRFAGNVGVSAAIRLIIRQFLKRLEQKQPLQAQPETTTAQAQAELAPQQLESTNV